MPTATPTPTATPSPEITPDYDDDAVAPGIENPGSVSLRIFGHNDSRWEARADVTITGPSGTEQASFTSVGDNTFEIDDLLPGNTYEVVVTDIQSVGSDVIQKVPPVETTFDPGQTDNVQLPTFPTFKQADTFEWDWRRIHGGFINKTTFKIKDREFLVEKRNQKIGGGIYDDGDWYLESSSVWVAEDDVNEVPAALSIGGEMYNHGFNGEWEELSTASINPEYQPMFAPVRDGLYNIRNKTLEYVGTWTLNDTGIPDPLTVRSMPDQNKGKEVDVYDIELWGYSERGETDWWIRERADRPARVYVDAETGHILRYRAPLRLSINHGGYDLVLGNNPSIWVVDFYHHTDENVTIDPDDYPPTEDE